VWNGDEWARTLSVRFLPIVKVRVFGEKSVGPIISAPRAWCMSSQPAIVIVLLGGMASVIALCIRAIACELGTWLEKTLDGEFQAKDS
jgi:hypothetical protein